PMLQGSIGTTAKRGARSSGEGRGMRMSGTSNSPRSSQPRNLRKHQRASTLPAYSELDVTCQGQNYRLHCRLVQQSKGQITHPAQQAPLFLAGHPALDFVNTQMRGNGQLIDLLQRDEDVLRWLRKAGFPRFAAVGSHFGNGALLNCARNLRENIRF